MGEYWENFSPMIVSHARVHLEPGGKIRYDTGMVMPYSLGPDLWLLVGAAAWSMRGLCQIYKVWTWIPWFFGPRGDFISVGSLFLQWDHEYRYRMYYNEQGMD